MNSRAWQQFARVHVVSRVPGMVLTNALLHLPYTAWLLRGVAMVTPSADAEVFQLWAFIQPLYVPANRLAFRYGRLLSRANDPHQTAWPDLPADPLGVEIATSIRTQAMHELLNVSEPGDLLGLIQGLPSYGADEAHLEAATYSAILAEDLTSVRQLSNQVRALTPTAGRIGAMHRLRKVLASYERDAAGAVSLLRCWRDDTARALRLP